MEYQYVPAPPLRSLFPTASEDALDLLTKMFGYDPEVRITAQQALEHRFETVAFDLPLQLLFSPSSSNTCFLSTV